jgi:ABC-type uncharacterized transport system permease subunit
MEQTLASIIAAASPLVIAAVGETITERAGIINLSLEGSLMLSAMTGFAAAQATGSVTVGFLAAALVGAAVALIVAVADIRLRLNQIAVGFVLAITCAELSTFLGSPFVREPGPSVTPRPIPVLAELPFVGPVLFDHDLLVYGSFLLVGAATWWLFRTQHGIDLRSVGERPEAAHARGLPVQRLRYLAAALGGGLIGVAGAAFTLSVKVGWSEGHTRNMGWIILAIVIFGGWHPVRVMLGCFAFGALQIAALRLQPVFPGLAQVLPIAPFPLMIMALLIVRLQVVRRFAESRPGFHRAVIGDPPSALGQPFHT